MKIFKRWFNRNKRRVIVIITLDKTLNFVLKKFAEINIRQRNSKTKVVQYDGNKSFKKYYYNQDENTVIINSYSRYDEIIKIVDKNIHAKFVFIAKNPLDVIGYGITSLETFRKMWDKELNIFIEEYKKWFKCGNTNVKFFRFEDLTNVPGSNLAQYEELLKFLDISSTRYTTNFRRKFLYKGNKYRGKNNFDRYNFGKTYERFLKNNKELKNQIQEKYNEELRKIGYDVGVLRY